MAKIDTDIPDQTWMAFCGALGIREDRSDFRAHLGSAFGRYKASLAHGGDVKPADVKETLLKCAQGCEAFLQSFGPLVSDADDGALSAAGIQLAIASGSDLLSFNKLVGTIINIRDSCLRVAPAYAVGGGPPPQDSRNIFILRLSRMLAKRNVLATDWTFSRATEILMKAAGAKSLPSDDSLERVVRKIRSETRARVNRKQPSRIRRG
jgi:hypothetical protein